MLKWHLDTVLCPVIGSLCHMVGKSAVIGSQAVAIGALGS